MQPDGFPSLHPFEVVILNPRRVIERKKEALNEYNEVDECMEQVSDSGSYRRFEAHLGG